MHISTQTLRIIKIGFGLAWVAFFVWSFRWFHQSGLHMRHLPLALKGIAHAAGFWGPLILIFAYVIRTFTFFPTAILTIATGSVFGPVWGTIILMIGENLSASIGFWVGRFLGRKYVVEHERGWVKKYDDLMKEEGFYTILFMRLLYFPIDAVNYGSGMTGIAYRKYAWATFMGLIPSIVTFTVLGDAFSDPRAFIFFLMLFFATLLAVALMLRLPNVRRRIFPPESHGS